MKKRIVVCGGMNSVYETVFSCLLANFPIEIALIKDDLFDQATFDQLASAADLQTHVDLISGDASLLKTADLLILTDIMPQQEKQSKADYVAAALPHFRALIGTAMSQGFAGKLCLLQTYDDIFTYLAWKFSGLPKANIFGLGTFTDTLILERLLQKRLRVGRHDVRDYVVGNSDHKIIAWSRAYLGASPLLSLVASDTTDFDADQMQQLEQQLTLIANSKQMATRTLSLQLIIRALFFEDGLISTFTALHHFDDKQQVAYSTPIYLSDAGVRMLTSVSLAEDEASELTAVKQATRDFLTKIETGQIGA
ncbi:lactate dehydrogenase [Loigolactobacillus backii]|uniref:lactate dehydrogenase n=1 Tax=Loigolactobacillus backii TaxID=375175 RepID=UPI000C1CB193|nr:lactate dehydrogenase [Loigolactobacillus backii]PIO83647.1 lactate dehydrogenase [Loigolactobacillus backii]